MKNYTKKRLEEFEKILRDGLSEDWYDRTPLEKQRAIDALSSTSINQAVAEERKRMVEEIKNTPIDTAHTYSSENADEYRTFDHGQESYKQRVLSIIDKPLADKERRL